MADKFQLKALITGVDKLSPTLAGVRKNISAFRKNLESTGLGKIGWSDIVTGGAMAAPFIAGARAAIDFESQMADVRKVVDFDTPDQFKKMGDDIGRMSERLPMAATDIAKIVAAGGQSGIARDELLGFAEAAVKMGIAFDQTADESGDMMAKWRTSFKLTQGDVETLADKINYLGNTGPANTKQISDIVTRIGPLGEIAGLASGQIAALGATMAGVGVEQDVAATGIKNFMLAMTKGSAATKAQANAFKALRLDSKMVSKAMQDDAQGAVLDILDRIKTIDKDKQAGILSELFGTESITAIAPLLTNLDLLKGNLAKVGDASKYAGSMEGEYSSRAATTANNMQLLRGSVMSVAREVGNALLPGINAVVDQLRPWISQVADLVRNNPQLVRGIVIAGAAFTALRAAVFTAMVATRLLGVAFAATPIGLIAVGIAAAAGLIVANWEKVGPFFTALWDLIRAAAVPVMDMMKTFFEWTPLGQIIKYWGPISAWFKKLWEGIKPYIEPLLKFMGMEDGGPGITAKVTQMAEAQRRRNAGEGGGTGDFLVANAGVKVKAAQEQRAQQFGITPGALLKAPGQLPDPGSLLRQSSAAAGKTQLNGELRVLFEGAPPGTRLEGAKSSQPGVTVTPQNVGRRTMGGSQ
ncbi:MULTISPECIES: phage tail tape measure protein [unclassified Pseudomonas]|uniref:phage tail tape measure protein n=1 Tax=unclassified Pseudomonas TaxID=196821 RepID=UPI000A0C92D9|nr:MULTISPECIES: phage tail tape measure protein [unclassified Pseudomonas]SMF36051.1 phage tail tape measure protein, TP901 family, core region [Pseudomonas sp. LAIL14HWK12:I11]SMR78995.1 phage tail tape measure protein, TP901 family, core region [Pseudomonas sp. LAIL14HWK12:I10]SOD04753.1 phage tail tape measure protein, TP901 family, core region [Pseudomonas sp. LAIL14HWK12:I8]